MCDKKTQFVQALCRVGGIAETFVSATDVAMYISEQVKGPLLLPNSPSLNRLGTLDALVKTGLTVVKEEFRKEGFKAEGGLTGANFAMAATGTIVLESTEEDVRIASTLPEKHFVVLDPGKIVTDYQAALPLIREMHDLLPQTYLAYLTGPSRTADIERVLTIGVHGPKELHVLLLEGVSDNFMER